MSEITVKVSKWGKRKNLAMFYICPQTGRRVMKSTGTHRLKYAQKAAGKWEDELWAGRYKPASKITWAEFRQRYEDEVLPSLAAKTDEMANTVFNAIERLCNPEKLSHLTAERLSYFQSKLRDEGRAEATVS